MKNYLYWILLCLALRTVAYSRESSAIQVRADNYANMFSFAGLTITER